MAEASKTRGAAGVGPFEGTFYALCSVIAWTVFNGFVFVATLFVVSATRYDIPWRGWAFVSGIALLPVALLALQAIERLREGPFIPKTTFGRAIFWIQIAGVAGLVLALLAPSLLLWDYLHPGGEVRIENPTEYAFSLKLTIAQQECGAGESVKPNTSTTIDFRPQDTLGFDCWGADVERFDIEFAYGSWRCAWPVEASDQPLVLSDSGPSCDVLSFEAGYLDPPVSPPPALPPGETSPFSPPPAQ